MKTVFQKCNDYEREYEYTEILLIQIQICIHSITYHGNLNISAYFSFLSLILILSWIPNLPL